ncbi:universal stress protein [Streptomyces sp. NPDC001415]
MEKPLVVGVDGSERSLRAVDWAADEADRHGVPLRLVYASLWEHYEAGTYAYGPATASERKLADAILTAADERAQSRKPGVKTTTSVLPQEPTDALLNESDSASMIVVGSRGRGDIKGMLLGSVGLGVAAWARCPVIVVRGDRTAVDSKHERILLGAGNPEGSAKTVDFAFREAEVRGSLLDVVRAWRGPAPGVRVLTSADDFEGAPDRRATAELDAALRDVGTAHPDVQVRSAAVEGRTHKVLVDRSQAADLLVVGARRNTGLGLQLGRTCHAALHHAACPVAVVPHAC